MWEMGPHGLEAVSELPPLWDPGSEPDLALTILMVPES